MLTANEKRCEERILKVLAESEEKLNEIVHKTGFSHETVTRLLVYMGLDPDVQGFYSYPDQYEPTGILPPIAEPVRAEPKPLPQRVVTRTHNSMPVVKEKEETYPVENAPMEETFFSKINKALEAQLDIMADKNLEGEKFEAEIKRTKAITDISKQMTDTGRLVLEAIKFDIEYGGGKVDRNLLSMG